MGTSCAAIRLYADDVILLAPSLHALQMLVNICDCELNFLDMAINPRKSSCMRFGPRHKSVCANVSVGFCISWTTLSRYLGVYLEGSVKFKCFFAKNKAGFYKAFNNIFGKIGRNASDEVLFAFIKSKCLPVLFYGTEACPITSADKHSLEFTVNKVLYKIFGAMSKDSYNEICKYFGIDKVEESISHRREKFVKRYSGYSNSLCHSISARL